MSLRKTLNILLFFVVSAYLTSLCFGQSVSRPDRGRNALVSFDSSGIEDINLQNGNLGLKIPLASLPPMPGGKLGFTVHAFYNSKLWDATVEERMIPAPPAHGGTATFYGVSVPTPSNLGGWRLGGAYSLEGDVALNDYKFNSGNYSPEQQLLQGYHQTFFVTPDGARHEMRPLNVAGYNGNMGMFFGYVKDSPMSTGQPMTYYSVDGSYIRMKIYPLNSTLAWEAHLKDGTKIEQAGDSSWQRIIDSNGNKVKIFSDSQSTHFQDEYTEREIRVFHNQSTGNQEVWFQSTGGAWQKIEIVLGETTVNGKFYTVSRPEAPYTAGCDFQEQTSGVFGVVREIIFPQTESTPIKYEFEYNSDRTSNNDAEYYPDCNMSPVTFNDPSHGFGEISKVTTPNGAIHEYSYSMDDAHVVAAHQGIPSNTVSEKKVTHDGETDVWTYSVGSSGAMIVNPDGSTFMQDAFDSSTGSTAASGGVNGLGGLVYRETSGPVRTERRWTKKVFTGANTLSPSGGFNGVTFNPVVTHEFTSLLNTSGSAVLMSAKTFQYDFNGNLLETKEYDWFDPSIVTRDGMGVPTTVPSSATLLRTTASTFHNSPSSNSSLDVYAKTSNTILAALKETTVGNSTTRFIYDGNSYGTAPTNGNVTTTSVWDSTQSQWINTSSTYDSKGNVTSSTDANGNVTHITYGSIGGYTGLCPTQIVSAYGTSIARTMSTGYDFSTGLPTSSTDVDNGITSATEYDIFGRPIKVVTAQGTTLESWTTTEYSDMNRR